MGEYDGPHEPVQLEFSEEGEIPTHILPPGMSTTRIRPGERGIHGYLTHDVFAYSKTEELGKRPGKKSKTRIYFVALSDGELYKDRKHSDIKVGDHLYPEKSPPGCNPRKIRREKSKS